MWARMGKQRNCDWWICVLYEYGVLSYEYWARGSLVNPKFLKQSWKRQSVLHNTIKRRCLYTRRWWCCIPIEGNIIERTNIGRSLDSAIALLEQKMQLHTTTWIGFIRDHHTCIFLLHLAWYAYETHLCTRGDIQSNIWLFKNPHGSNGCPLDNSSNLRAFPVTVR